MMDLIAKKLTGTNNNWWKNFLLVVAIFTLLFLMYTPIFETNDDVAMSMIAHGYGFALKASAHIMFSNIIYGWIVSHLPTIYGFYPYSYMTLFALLVVSFSLLYFLEVLAVKPIYAAAFLLMILARPFAMPQFTINAGLLALAAIAGVLAYQKTNKNFHLFLALGLAFYSFLVRSEEFYLVVIVSSPLWLNKKLLNREFIFSLMGLIIACVLAKFINSYAYSGVEFSNYNAFAKARLPFTDFGAAAYFSERPNILAKYGYTVNDMQLIGKFIFADNNIADPVRLNALLTNFNFSNRIYDNFNLALEGIISIFDLSFRVLLIVSLFTVLSGHNKSKFIFSWLLFISIIIFLSLLGRPSILRIYYPVIAMLAILPVIYIDLPKRTLAIVLIAILGLTLYKNYLVNAPRVFRAKLAREDILKLNVNDVYYVYGAGLPYELLDLATKPFPRGYKLYWFASAYYLPDTSSNHYAFSAYSFENMLKNGHSLKLIAGVNVNNPDMATFKNYYERLSNRPILRGSNLKAMLENANSLQLAISRDEYVSETDTYCKEHFNKHLNVIDIQRLNTFTVYTIQCN